MIETFVGDGGLVETFAGSATQVDVQIFTYASDVEAKVVFDLQSADVLANLESLRDDYSGGTTNWTSPLQGVVDFFLGPTQGFEEANFLIFVSDGLPTSGSWRTPLAALTDPDDAYKVDISVFGFGDIFDPVSGSAELQELNGGEEPGFFDDPSDLTALLQTTPIFNPTLISFEVELRADGGAPASIADETAAGLIVEGTDFGCRWPALKTLLIFWAR